MDIGTIVSIIIFLITQIIGLVGIYIALTTRLTKLEDSKTEVIKNIADNKTEVHDIKEDLKKINEKIAENEVSMYKDFKTRQSMDGS